MPDPTPSPSLSRALGGDADAEAARAAIVDHTFRSTDLASGPAADAVRVLPRRVLRAQTHVRRGAPEGIPYRWELRGRPMNGDGEGVWSEGAPYDRVCVSFAVPLRDERPPLWDGAA